MVSALQIHNIHRGATLDDIGKYLDGINKAMIFYEINTRSRVCMFLAHLLWETTALSKMRENLNYSAKGLMETFSSHFANIAEAGAYERKPEMIANRVYASRYGNGPESSGDGWKYRGGGGFHATFRDMYNLLSKEFSLDLIGKPELIIQPDIAMMSAGFIWKQKSMNAFADTGDLNRSCKALNGGFNGLAERKGLYEKCLTVILK